MESSPEKDSQPGNVRELDFDDESLRAIAEVYKNGGNDEFNKKEYRNAINSYTEGINVNCKDEELNAKLYSNRATAHFRLGNYQECLYDVKATVELQPEFIKAMARGASACMELGLYEEAITWCNKGLVINKNSRTLLDLRNKSAYQRNKVQESTGEKVHGYPQRQIVYLKRCAKTVKDRTKEAGGCTGIAFRSLEESRRVKDYYEHRLKIAQQVKDKFGEGSEYCNLGNVYYSLNNFQKAIKCHERSLEISKEIKDRSSEGRAYCNLGHNFGNLREFKKAIEFLDLARKIATDVNDSIEEARACHNLGTVYCKLKQFKKALDYHERCLKIAKQVEDRTGEGHSYCNLGTDYFGLRDLKKALEYLKCGLNILKEVEDKYGQERAYRGIGAVYNNLKDFKTAIYYLKSCIKISKEVGDRLAERFAYEDLGKAYAGLQDFKNAIHYHDRCFQIAKEDGDQYAEAIALSNLGQVYSSMKHFEKSIDCFENCLKISKEVKDRTLEEDTYLYLHATYNDLGDWKKSRYYLELCLKVAKDQEHRLKEAKTYFLLGNECFRLGNVEEAIGFLKRYQNIATEVGERELEADACHNLGGLYDHLGDFWKAKDYSERCLKISKEIGDKNLEKKGYCGLGNAYISLGDLKKAIDCFQRSLQIAKELGDGQSEEGPYYAYGGLGNTYCALGDYKRAIYYDERCLDIAKRLGDRRVESQAYGNLANAYFYLQDFKTSIKYNELLLTIAIEQENKYGQKTAYQNLGNNYSRLGENGKAIKYFELSLKIAKETKDRSEEGRTYGNIGLCHCRMGNFVRAKEYQKLHLEIALELDEMEEVGVANGNLAISLEYLGFLHDAVDCYKSSIKAFDVMWSRLQSNDEWKVTFSDKLQAMSAYTSLTNLLLRMGKSVEALCAAENGRAQALNDLLHSNYGFRATNNAKSNIEEDSIHYIFRGIHCEVIFPLFLHGFIALWLIQRGNHVSSRAKEASCPGTREDVVNYVQKLVESTLEGIGVGSDMNCEDRSLDRLKNPSIAEKRYNQTVQHSLQLQNHHLKRLYDFFIAPVADLIHVDEIVIVPEGPLWLAPFAAFMDSNSRFLSDSFRIRVIPSLTSLRLILDCPADYHSKTGVLLVGDPWVQDVTVDEGGKLDQLPYARKEVEMIGRILKASPLTGKEATKDEVLKRLSSVTLVHIAAHGRMETGEIALCPNPSRTSLEPEDEDFILSMSDVLNVKLRAKLVVLSCCHSGRGEIKAEGVVGIARAFMGAGARSVLVSLWAIDDEATLDFMKTFYQHLVEGKGASESLNRAMKSMRKSQRFSDVKYWAPFVLIGDDVSLQFAKND